MSIDTIQPPVGSATKENADIKEGSGDAPQPINDVVCPLTKLNCSHLYCLTSGKCYMQGE